MPVQKLVLIHTSRTLIPIFQKLCEEILPNMELLSRADESLINDVVAFGSVSNDVSQRVSQIVREAEREGADLIMVTCSSIGEAVEAAQQFSQVPVLRVDQAMAEQAVSLASRIGVVASLVTTLTPTVNLIRRSADAADKRVDVQTALCDGAFAALMNGDSETHDRLVRENLESLMPSVDVIVLAQASMARVVQHMLPASIRVPILSSPRLAIESLKARFA